MRTTRNKKVSYKEASESSEEEDGPLKEVRSQGKSEAYEEDHESSDSDFGASKKKRSKKAKTRKGKKGATEMKSVRTNPMTLLPTELFFEVLTYLSPKDLLSLARLNKGYRSVLMSKAQSESIWKKAFKAVKLPELTADDWSLPACADLVFTTHCCECGRYAPSFADPWLRRRLCKPCRKISLIKLTHSYISVNNLHPRIYSCVVGSHHTLSNGYWTRKDSYVLAEEIDAVHAKLNELQEQDDVDIVGGTVDFEKLERESARHCWTVTKTDHISMSNVSPAPRPSTDRSNGSSRSSRSSKNRKNYFEGDNEDEAPEDSNLVYRIGPRVQAFVEERESYVAKVFQDGLELAEVNQAVATQVRRTDEFNAMHVQQQRGRDPFEAAAGIRRVGIKNRLAETEGYTRADCALLSEKKLDPFLDGGEITDDEWTRIRPEITRIVDVARTSKARKDHQNRLSESEASRKNSLRSYYNELLEDLDDGQYPPLFEEFLELSSVRPLWTREDVEDLREVVEETKWLNALEAVQAEFEDYHVALIEEAIRLILKTNEGYTEAEEADLEEAVAATMAGDLDAFFNKASSAVFCDLGCETEVSLSVGFNFMLGYRSDREKKVKKASFFGTFPEVVAHQLSHHNSHKATPSKPERGKTPPTGSFSHFSLPLEVASVVGDLVDLFETSHPIDLRHLDLLSKGYLKCKDLPGQSWFPDWKSLINRVYVVARKNARAKPPINIEPPLVVFRAASDWLRSCVTAKQLGGGGVVKDEPMDSDHDFGF